ncbi:MAG: type secretion rane fusion protein, HlyD family [Firmicutes bacterium]|nr:type secretion rane fusion protein, HlyD family [Bacillota bacterium]
MEKKTGYLAKWLGTKRKGNETLAPEETEFLPAILEITENPVSPTVRMLIAVLVAIIGVAFLWSVFGHVDEVAVAPGKIIPSGYVKVIQPESKGVVKQINVKDGQTVKSGDLLIELDQTISGAELARIKKEVAYYNLEIDRLLAEMNNAPFTPQPSPDLDDKDLSFQMSLYMSRTADFNSKMAVARHSVNQGEASVNVARVNRDKYASLYEIARDRENRLEQLMVQNAISTFTVLEYRGRRIELEQNLAAQEGEIIRAEAALAQSREAMQSVIAERNRDITAKMVEDRKALQVALETLKMANEKNRLARLTSPIDGRVTQLAVHTIGGVVTEAQPLMVIVPADVTLEVEAWAANQDIGFIYSGQQAEVKVETFNFQKYGYLDAHVTQISPDAIEDKEKGRVYRVTLQLDRDYLIVGDKKVYLGPGMTVSAEIKTREKRIIEFFLDPFRKYQSEGLRER